MRCYILLNIFFKIWHSLKGIRDFSFLKTPYWSSLAAKTCCAGDLSHWYELAVFSI